MDKLRVTLHKLLKPTLAKVIIFVIVAIYAAHAFFLTAGIGHSPTPLAKYVLAPIEWAGLWALLLFIPYVYILAGFLTELGKKVLLRKWILGLAIVFIFFILGLDEPLINATVNKPSLACSADASCVIKSIKRGGCGQPKCVNAEWEYYDSFVNRAFGLSCGSPLLVCSCQNNQCQTRNLYYDGILKDCENFSGFRKEECIEMIKSRDNKVSKPVTR